MAKRHIVSINIPMAEALRKLLVRNECPVCSQEIECHSEITLTDAGKVVDCSNNGGK